MAVLGQRGQDLLFFSAGVLGQRGQDLLFFSAGGLCLSRWGGAPTTPLRGPTPPLRQQVYPSLYTSWPSAYMADCCKKEAFGVHAIYSRPLFEQIQD